MLGRALPGVPGNLCRGWPSTQPFLRGRWSPRLETLEPPRAEGRTVGFPSIHRGVQICFAPLSFSPCQRRVLFP